MTITQSTRLQLFEKTRVIRMDQKRHAPLEAKTPTASSPFALGTWTVEEHHLFLEALDLYPSGPWKLVAQHIGSRTPRQVMTHAQKYRQRLQRRVTTTRVEPTEPPRRASNETPISKVLSVVVSPMTAGTTGEIQVEAGICVLPARPATFADDPPTYGQFPFIDEFLAQLAMDPMFDCVDMTMPYADLEPLQF